MPIYRRGIAPVDIRLGIRNALQVYLGERLIWDGTVPVLIEAPRLRVALTMPDPTVRAAATVAAPALAAAAHVPDPNAGAGAGADAPALVAAGSIPAPVVGVGVTVDAPPLGAVATVPTPAVGETVVDAPALGLVGTVPTPDVSAAVRISAPALTAAGAVPPVDFSGGVTVTPPPLVGVGTLPAPEFLSGVTYTDDFNRASLDGNWAIVGSLAPVIANSDRVQAGTGGPINTTSPYVARRASAVATDNHRSRAVLTTPVGSANLNLGVGLWVRGTTGGDRVEALFTPTAVTISTKTGGSGGTSTTRATQGSLSLAAGAVVELVAAGNVYTAYADGVALVSWTDSGAVIPIDASHRSVGITLFSNRNFSSSYTYGWALDDWVGRDG